MELQTISKERGITAIYDGYKYIIHSSFYGLVAYSSNIERNSEYDKVKIDFVICGGCVGWYWNLSNIIKRGVAKMERQYLPEKQVKINFTYEDGGHNSIQSKKLFVDLQEA